jgi:hypothetical protein
VPDNFVNSFFGKKGQACRQNEHSKFEILNPKQIPNLNAPMFKTGKKGNKHPDLSGSQAPFFGALQGGRLGIKWFYGKN